MRPTLPRLLAVLLLALVASALPASALVPEGPGDSQTSAPVSARPAAPVPPRDRWARWAWPLQPRSPVARGFVRPESSWSSGHRGLDLVGRPAQPVLAVEAGVVTHVGVVAGRPTVTVTHRDGLRSTYEPVRSTLRAGADVAAGALVGTLEAPASHCPPGTCLHLGAARGSAYLDPLPLLASPPLVLLPWG